MARQARVEVWAPPLAIVYLAVCEVCAKKLRAYLLKDQAYRRAQRHADKHGHRCCVQRAVFPSYFDLGIMRQIRKRQRKQAPPLPAQVAAASGGSP